MHDEGLVKFTCQHRTTELSLELHGDMCYRLIAWRRIMSETALVGKDPPRYGGASYGNLSGRVPPYPGERGARRFLITGTDTSGQECMSVSDFSLVEEYNYRENSVVSRGPTRPSSESMTHGAIYDLDERIRNAFHAHSPVIWEQARALGLPTTDPKVAYGTPEMALEIPRLYRTTNLADMKILAMGGHQDGIVVFGARAEEVGSTLMSWLSRAYEKQCRAAGILCASTPKPK